jgi:hypothetical protein
MRQEPDRIEEWPAILRDYEAAIAEFETVSRALTAALADRFPDDYDFHDLIASEEKARVAVIFARTRIMNRLRDSARVVH